MDDVFQHPKIASLRPVWAPFPGYSYILNQSGDQTTPYTFAQSRETADSFAMLEAAIEGFGRARLLKDAWLCLLNPASYHITALDLINHGNLRKITENKIQSLAKEAIYAIREDALEPQRFFDELKMPMETQVFNIRFQFMELNFESRGALMVQLEPVDAQSKQELQRFKVWRDEVGYEFSRKTGLRHKTYNPHITLGYYVFRDRKKPRMDMLKEFETYLISSMKGLVFSFDQVCIYKFTDMVSYRRIGK